MIETEAAYIAGFLDGDGSISGHKRSWGHTGVQVTLTNCDAEVLLELARLTGGHLCTQGRRSKKHRDHHQLVHYAATAERLLRATLPYLRIKRMQAEIALMVLANRGRGTGRLAPGVLDMRRWCMETISRLNKGHVAPELHSVFYPEIA